MRSIVPLRLTAPLRSRRRRLPVRAAVIAAVASLVAAAGIAVATTASAAGEPYRDPSLPVATRVNDLLSRMSLDEKLGQLTQAERASITNAQITQYRIGSILSGGGSAPGNNSATGWADMVDGFQNAALATPLQIPLIYGADAVHGHNNVVGATIFPHNIGLGATRNPTLVGNIGRAVAEEIAGTGVDWDFAPCLCVARNDRWGRTYESFGEKPEIASSMTTIITGLQGSTLGGPASVLATAKHYIGDGGTTGGTDQGNTQITEAELRAIHLPPFQAAVQRNVGSVMISYSSWNGSKLHGNQYLINTVLKGELGFTGFVVSDWNGVDQIDGAVGLSATDVRTAINAGIDMVMAPTGWQTFISLLRTEVQAGRVTQARIDDATRRILTKKFELGMFERPMADRTYASTVGSSAHRTLARQAVAQSQVVLKNANNILPLAKDSNKIFVAGKSADNIGNQSGGWTISWQGSSGNITPGTTILQGIRNTAGSSSTVTYNATGAGIDSSYKVAIAVVGETPYAEGQGDRTGSMSLDTTDLNTIQTLRNAGVPVVVLLVSGRPLDIASQLPNWSALVASWLPGTEGQGVADVLFNVVAPTGKLPVTWMQSVSQQPINDGDGKTPLFAYGFGLTYTAAPDTTPPSTPGTPTASGVTASSASLAWTASTDNTAVTGYDVVRVQGTTETTVASPTTASATLTGLTAATAYTFAVYAKDAAGNRSARSGTVAVTTSAATDTQPPTAPGTPAASGISCSSVTLSWTAATDNSGSVTYDVLRGGIVVATTTSTSATITGLTGSTSYQFQIRARDAAGNSALSSTIAVTTPACTDTTAPSTPGTPTASGITASSVTLAWAASTDNIAVTGYDVVRIQGTTETTVASPTTTSATLTGLTANTAYSFAVYAKDAAGNRSIRSGTVAVTTSSTTTAYCRVTYAVNDWGSGFGANITITNTSGATINGWTLRFVFPGNQRVTQGWSALFTQTGQEVVITNQSWNATIAPSANVSVGFNGSYTGSNPAPTAFTLNGNPCTVG